MATGSEEVEERESLCSSCSKLREEIESTKKEHALTIRIIKQKIISTDELIRKYQKKCQDFDRLTKQLEELSKNYEDSQSNVGTLQMQLEKSMQAGETLRKNIGMLDRDRRLAESNIKTLQEKLGKSESMCANLQTILNKKEEGECAWRFEQQLQAQEMQKKDELIKKNKDSLLKVQNQLSKERESKKDQAKELSAVKRKVAKLEKQLCQVKDKRSTFPNRNMIRKEHTPEPAVTPAECLATPNKDVCTTPQKNKAKKGRGVLPRPETTASKSLIPDDMLFFLRPPVSPLPSSPSPMRPAQRSSSTEREAWQGDMLSDSSIDDGDKNYSSDSSLGSLCDLLGYGNVGRDKADNRLVRDREEKKSANEVESSLERHLAGNNRIESVRGQNEAVAITTKPLSSKSSQNGLKVKSKHTSILALDDVKKPSERMECHEDNENEFGVKRKSLITVDEQVTWTSGEIETFNNEEVKCDKENSKASSEEKKEILSGETQTFKSENTMLGKQNRPTSVAGEMKEKSSGKTEDSDEASVDIGIKSISKDKESKMFSGDSYEENDCSTSGQVPREHYGNTQNKAPREHYGNTQNKAPREHYGNTQNKDWKILIETTKQYENIGEDQTAYDPVDSISNQKERTSNKDEIKITVSTPEEKVSNKYVVPKLVLSEKETPLSLEKAIDAKSLEINENNNELKGSRKHSAENSKYAIGRDHVNVLTEEEESNKVVRDDVATKVETSRTNKNLDNVSPSSKGKDSRKRKYSAETVDTPARITRSKSRLLANSGNSDELLSSDDSDKRTSNISGKTKMPRLEKEVLSGDVNSNTQADAVSSNDLSEETKEKVVLEWDGSQVGDKTNNLIPRVEISSAPSNIPTCQGQSGVGKLTISHLDQLNSQIIQGNKHCLGKLESKGSDSKAQWNNKNNKDNLKIPEVVLSTSEEVQESAMDNLLITQKKPNDAKHLSYSPDKNSLFSPLSPPLSLLSPSTSSMCVSPVSPQACMRPSIIRDLELFDDLGPPVSPLPPSPPHHNMEPLSPNPSFRESDLIPSKDETSSAPEKTSVRNISARTNENQSQSKCKGLSVRPAHMKEVKYAFKCFKRVGDGDVDQKVVTTRFRDKKCLSTSAPLVAAIIPFLKENTTDLTSDIVSQCRNWKEKDKLKTNEIGVQFVEDWKPVMTLFELDLLEVLMITSTADQHRGLIGDIICQLNRSIADSCSACADDWTGMESQCRFLTALCRRQNEGKRVKILVYDILRVLHHSPARAVRLALGIAAVWPAAFRLDDVTTPNPLRDVDLANSSQSPLLCAVSVVLKKWAVDASLGDNRYLFEFLWPSNYGICQNDLGKLASELVSVLRRGPFTTLHVASDGLFSLESGAFETVKALELIACVLGWEWSHNVLIGQLLWEILKSWACANESQENKGFKQETDVIENKEAALEDKTKQGIHEACVVAVIQLIGLLCRTAIEHTETPALDIVTLLCGILKQASSNPLVTHNVQAATAFSLLQVSPWQIAQVSSCLQQWNKSTSVPLPPGLVQGIECVRKMVPLP